MVTWTHHCAYLNVVLHVSDCLATKFALRRDDRHSILSSSISAADKLYHARKRT